jgi:hypothetical protein
MLSMIRVVCLHHMNLNPARKRSETSQIQVTSANTGIAVPPKYPGRRSRSTIPFSSRHSVNRPSPLELMSKPLPLPNIGGAPKVLASKSSDFVKAFRSTLRRSSI